MPFGHFLGDVLLGALVGSESSYGYDADGGIRLPVAAAVRPVPICHSRRDGNGATPQSMAKDVSDLSLSRLPPTVTISWAADWAYAAQGLVGPRVAVEPHPLVDPPLPQMLGVGKRLAVDESPLQAVAGRLDHGVVVWAALLRRGPLDALANPLPRPS